MLRTMTRGGLASRIFRSPSIFWLTKHWRHDLKMREAKPPLVNQQCLVYKFECDLCDVGYVGYTSRHLHLKF